jgi:hypothetical protein
LRDDWDAELHIPAEHHLCGAHVVRRGDGLYGGVAEGGAGMSIATKGGVAGDQHAMLLTPGEDLGKGLVVCGKFSAGQSCVDIPGGIRQGFLSVLPLLGKN